MSGDAVIQNGDPRGHDGDLGRRRNEPRRQHAAAVVVMRDRAVIVSLGKTIVRVMSGPCAGVVVCVHVAVGGRRVVAMRVVTVGCSIVAVRVRMIGHALDIVVVVPVDNRHMVVVFVPLIG